MGLESVTHISDLNASNPASGDAKSQGDDHIRNIKTALKTDFPNINGVVSASDEELSFVAGVTSAIQTQLNAKASLASPAFTGTPTVPTAATSTNTTQAASTAFVQAVMNTAPAGSLPALSTNALKTLRVNVSETAVEWGSSSLFRSQRISNTILGASDSGTLIDITSGTFTQTFTAAATLGDGWFCYIRNSGTGDITLDPNASETIDGLTSFVMYPGECRLVICTGTAFFSTVLTPFNRTFTATGTFTTPPGYGYFGGRMWGGGGSGRKSSASNTAGGGGGGSCVDFIVPASTLGATATVTVGTGGLAQTTADTNGNAGGSSSFSTYIAYGGGAGLTTDGIGGSAFLPGLTYAQNSYLGGGTASATTPTVLGGGTSVQTNGYGPTVFGGGGGGANTSSATRTPSSTVFGGPGGAASLAGNGTDGTVPGGGGGATQTGTQSGAGARGEVRIWGIV